MTLARLILFLLVPPAAAYAAVIAFWGSLQLRRHAVDAVFAFDELPSPGTQR